MPSAAARRIYEDQIPSFMSVFDLDAELMADRETVTVVNPKLVEMESKAPAMASPSRQPDISSGCLSPDHARHHRDSTPTHTSESADSSPTTTLSTTDSSPLSDPSPSSSPDSPLNLVPLNNFPTLGAQPSSRSLLGVSQGNTLQRATTSPTPRRPRNMKGLSIQPPAVVTTMPTSMVSEPCSPSFIKPTIAAMKRKPSLLSIKTNTLDLGNKPSLEVPASPAMPPILQRRALKHSTSSPHMLSSMKTSTFGPAGGMSFPKMLERNESGLSEVLRPMKSSMNSTFDGTILEEESPIKMQLANRAEDGQCHENENNEDQKSPGYPDGPIAIYGDNVYLYLEPAAEEASRFDVVINVAREVNNPFDAKQETSASPAPGHFPQGHATPSHQSPIPDTAVSTASYATAWEYQPSDDRSMETPTTPKANPFKMPEYIHVMWDHNTDISPDLLNLCETIENRTKEGKKVLVHCQQGASRSASLIIAYGLYLSPELSVNDAYYAAQTKSRWISPNMKLMYSLQDFHKQLSKSRIPPTSGVYRPRTGRSPNKHRLTLSADAIEMARKHPHTAPLPTEDSREKLGHANLNSTSRFGGGSGFQSISPGPASAPLSFSWRENLEKSHADQKEPDQKKAKQGESEREEPELRELKLTHLGPRRLELPSPFKLQAPPQRPKSDQGRKKLSFAPLVDSWLKPATPAESRSHSSLGFRSHSLCLQEQTPRELPRGLNPMERTVTLSSAYPDNGLPLSPRVEAMTNNPLRKFSDVSGMRFMTSSQEPAGGLFSPRQALFPRDVFYPFGQPAQIADPRSPPTKGEAPIIRSIDDIL